jgi:hypothetical protein
MNIRVLLFVCILIVAGCQQNKEECVPSVSLRAPAYPLITIDPYTNAWSFGDRLYENDVVHWTGKSFPLVGALRVDGTTYRFMGTDRVRTFPIVTTSDVKEWTAKYVLEVPQKGWEQPAYNDRYWQEGNAAFGKRRDEVLIKTPWETEHIWVRREVLLDEDLTGKTVYLDYTHDDDVEIFVNGEKVVDTGNAVGVNSRIKLPEKVVSSLKKGRNVIAAHCWNRRGEAFLDFGLSLELTGQVFMDQTAEQIKVEVFPTQTVYKFKCGPVDLLLKFTAPLLLNDLELLSRPVNYISYEVFSTDSENHQTELYLEASPNWALDRPSQESFSETFENDGLLFVKSGSMSQSILGKSGDDVRIDWGHFYLATDLKDAEAAIGNEELRTNFCKTGNLLTKEPNGSTLSANSKSLSIRKNLGDVSKEGIKGYFMLGYDDIFSMQFFGTNIRPYWNRKGNTDIFNIFRKATEEYNSLIKKCQKFDAKLICDATKTGGKEYAELCALAYRQTISAHKLIESPDGELYFMSKENFSHGGIATVDVSYPSAPFFLLYNVELAKGLLNPIFYYCEFGGWNEPFAPHDVGIYPIANGQSREISMPIEESANMLILTAAIATMEGNALYAEKHWSVLTRWVDFLLKKGVDLEVQRYTDNFTGFSAHNTNLSIKSILAIASYGRLADMLGKNDISQYYTSRARLMAQEWVKLAEDGDHYKFAFDKPGTWSQKYNLVWDKVMRMNVFPHAVAEKEVNYYLTKQQKYGLPLDSRNMHTKADWIVWTATLSPNKESFQEFIIPLYRFVNETTDRVPMSDWYWTDKPIRAGFQARSVVGGFFIKMMEDKLNRQ